MNQRTIVKQAGATAILLATMIVASAQREFSVKGKLSDTTKEGAKVTFSYYNGTKSVYTAAIIKQGTFEFKGIVNEPAKASLSMPLPKSEATNPVWPMSEKAECYIEGGIVAVEGTRLSKATITTGGKPQLEFLKLQAARKPFEQGESESYTKMLDAIRAKDSASVRAFRDRNNYYKSAIDSVERVFIAAHPASFVSLDLVKERVTPKALAEEKEKSASLFNSLDNSIKSTVGGKAIAEQIRIAYTLSLGKPAIEFTSTDTLGKPVSLKDFRGKYVLLDFWASWCIPCRFENKTVLKAYNQFRDKNFTVLSVSLEKPGDQKAWLDAIHKDSLTWAHASDHASGSNKTADAYGVKSIPMNYLIDPKGNIVALHLRGEALVKKLEELLN